MEYSLATIFGTAALGLLKRKLGSNARRSSIVKKKFDNVILGPGFWTPDKRKEVFFRAPELDGILYIHFSIYDDQCYEPDAENTPWCYGLIRIILDPSGKYANWNEDDDIHKEVIELGESAFLFNYVHQVARDNGLQISEEDTDHGVEFDKIELFTDMYGNPIIKSGAEYNKPKLRRR